MRKEGEMWWAMLSKMHLAREVIAKAGRETGELLHELKQHMRRCIFWVEQNDCARFSNQAVEDLLDPTSPSEAEGRESGNHHQSGDRPMISGAVQAPDSHQPGHQPGYGCDQPG